MPTQDELLLKIIEEGSDNAAKGLDDVAGSLDKVTKKQDNLTESAQKSEKGFKGLTVGMADLKAGLDIVSNVGGKVIDFLKDAVDGTIEYAAQVRDLSRSIGANAEETSSLIQVADDVGVSVEDLGLAFKGAIQKGIQPNIDGLSKLADEYNAIENPVARSQFAISKFGEAGLKMAKILEQGGEAIKGAAQEAKALGLTLSEEDVKAAREMEIQMDNLGDKVEAVKTSLAKGLIPRLVEFFDTIDRGLKTADLLLNWNNNIQVGIQGLNKELLTGKIAYQDYSAAIVGAAVATGQMSQAEADALINGTARESLIRGANQQFGLLTRAQFEATQGAYGYASALDESGRAAQRSAEAQASQNESVDAASAAQDRYYAALAESARVTQEKKIADEEAAKAQEAFRVKIADAGTAAANAAQQFKTATDVQIKQALAQGQIDTLSKALKDGTISQEGYNKAVDQVLLRYDLATPKSIAVAEAQQKVNEAFLNGQLPLKDYVTSSEKIPKIAEDGKVTLEELASLGIKPVTAAVDDQKMTVEKLGSAWDKIPAQVKTVYTIQVNGEPPEGGTSTPNKPKTPGFATGANFTVPPGYPNDSYPMRVSSGERVIVQPQNSVSNTWNVQADQAGMALLLERQRMMNSQAFEARM